MIEIEHRDVLMNRLHDHQKYPFGLKVTTTHVNVLECDELPIHGFSSKFKNIHVDRPKEFKKNKMKLTI